MLAPLDLVVLVTLSRRSQGTHGYDLLQTLRDEHEIDAATTSLYRSLRQLLDRGLIIEAEPMPGDDPRRRRYSITSAGSQAVAMEQKRLTRLFRTFVRPARAHA